MTTIRILSLCSGTIGRAAYFLIGVTLLAIKFGIDCSVSHAVFHRPWSPAEYIAPGVSAGFLLVAPHERLFYATMLLIALPFITCGVMLTAMRLRSVGIPVGWTVLFFVPGAWYRHHMWPAMYGRLWSDSIIHRIHLRVLNHVKGLSESEENL